MGLVVAPVAAQPTPASLTGSTLSQNFDGMTVAAGATLPIGFGFSSTGATNTSFSTATTVTTQSANGTLSFSGTGGAYVFNVTNTSDRAIGFLSAGSFSSPRSIVFGFTNDSGQIVTQLDLAFDYEKYRTGTRAFNFNLFSSDTGAAGSFSAVPAGNQNFPADGTVATANFPNAPLSTVAKTATVGGLNIAPGDDYYFLFEYVGVGGSTNAQALGVDNVVLTATLTPVPEPATLLGLAAGGLGVVRLRRRPA